MTTTSNISAKTHVFFSVLYLVQQISTDRSKGSQSLNKLIHTVHTSHPPRARAYVGRIRRGTPSPTQTGDHTRGFARALPAHQRSRAARRAPHRAIRRGVDGRLAHGMRSLPTTASASTWSSQSWALVRTPAHWVPGKRTERQGGAAGRRCQEDRAPWRQRPWQTESISS